MKTKRLTYAFLLVLACCLCACEHVDMEKYASGDGVDITFRVDKLEQIPFETSNITSRAVNDLSKVCSRINLAVFEGENKVTSFDQTSDTPGFGTLKIKLPKGNYTIVIVAHSGLGNATLSSPTKVSFYKNKVTDTFNYVANITVGDQSSDYNIELKRAVAKFRLRINDDQIPAEVKQFKFYYTGGSSTLNCVTGFGEVNSRQTEYRDIPTKSSDGYYIFDVYTFPHADGKELKMKIDAIDVAGNSIQGAEFPLVPVTTNRITQYTGQFFSGIQANSPAGIKISIDDSWDSSYYNVTF